MTIETTSAGDMGDVGALASQRMELLRNVPFDNLTAGGSLTGNTTGFFDNSSAGFVVRWRITDDATPPSVKTITVRAIAMRQVVGERKEITLTTLRGR